MSNASSKKSTEEGHPSHTSQPVQTTWGPVAAILFTVFVYFGSQFLAAMMLGLVAAVTNLSVGPADPGYSYIEGQFYFVVFSDALLLAGIWLYLHVRQTNVRALGFGRRPVWGDALYAALGYIVYFLLLIAAMALVGNLAGVDLNQRQELGFDQLFTNTQKLMGLVALVVLPPIVEETIFRGFLFTGLRKKLTFTNATIITSLIFAAPHLLASSHGLLWVAGVDTLVLSLVLCYLREKTGALWASMAVHAVKNVIAYGLLLASIK